MEVQKKRRSRHKREAPVKQVNITERDLNTFEAIYKRRAATTEQLSQLLFGREQDSYVRKRLADLFHDRYLRRRWEVDPYGSAASKIIHLVDRKGGKLLSEQRGFTMKSSEYDTLSQDFLEHTLAITDVEIAFQQACREFGYVLSNWQWERFIRADYDRVLIKGDKAHAVQPDSYGAITIPHKLLSATTHYLIEVDRGTEVRKQFEPKIRAYIAYFGSPECKARYRTHRLRVLVITTSMRRLTNIKEITQKVGGKSRFWFTTLKELTNGNPLSNPIWQVAGREGMFSLLDPASEKGIAAVLATPFISLSTRSSLR